MRKSRFTESQIVAILTAHDARAPTAELARKHGIYSNPLRRGGRSAAAWKPATSQG